MLSNTGSKQRFPCQQFRAPSQPDTLQSASFGYGNTDSLSLCLKKLKLFIKVHTRVLKHWQECDGWVQRTLAKRKNGQGNYAVFIIQLVMLVIGVFLTSSRVLYSFSPLFHIFYYFCDCFNPGRWNICDASGATFVFAAVSLWLVTLSHVLLYFLCCGQWQIVFFRAGFSNPARI